MLRTLQQHSNISSIYSTVFVCRNVTSNRFQYDNTLEESIRSAKWFMHIIFLYFNQSCFNFVLMEGFN
ncbi:hypothetical protein ACH3XW_35800 [Acanthocheilonema viteae]